mmetsp:Transcript_9842/g.19634  ORF Transcript_9842/g.19634 Transcript_9842/m.19634 type:complete len:122 (-) Transcript_9842:40-405(-)|eukprot:CAMPEP_0182458462 /NCGR_PEP_ID=MMETSP1319-20130603/3804_1 /TAXON_ID=172717 /ORGANISM="Bolidomonas pacifica, Strain RCC208" /LENGTH=121 /DNA_ID=CAMNT_0024657155 /DNA_START=203 /DNA_END=568 /DNA_ORIENTATION=-
MSFIPKHSAHLWKIGGVLFALGTGIKFITYELVSGDIKKRGDQDTRNCRRVLDLAGAPSELSTSLQSKTGLRYANDLKPLSNEDKIKMKAMLVEMGGTSDLVEMERDLKLEQTPNPRRQVY